MYKEHDTDALSENPDKCRLIEGAELAPAADEKEIEISAEKENTSNTIALKEEVFHMCNLPNISMFFDILTGFNSRISLQQAAEAILALAEEKEVARSAEDAEPSSSRVTSEETNLPSAADVSRHSEEETSEEQLESEMREAKNSDEKPIPSENFASMDEISANDKNLEIKHYAQSSNIPHEDIDLKEGDTSNSYKGREKRAFTTEDEVEIKGQYVQDEPLTAESHKNEEAACEVSLTESPENSLMLPPKETIEANLEVYEAPEDDKNTEEIPMQEEKLTDATINSATYNEKEEGLDNIYVNSQMQSEEKMHNSEDEILMRNDIEDVSEQSKMSEPKVLDKNSSNQKV